MTLQKNVLHLLKPGVLFFYVGLIGYVIFFLLRPSIDLTSNASIDFSSKKAIQRVHDVNQRLGIQSDTLKTSAFRFQNLSLYSRLKESTSYLNLSPHILNRSGAPLNTWRVTSGFQYEELTPISTDTQIFNDVGVTQATLSNQNQIISYRINENRNSSFYPAELTYQDLIFIIRDIFGYETENYVYDDIPVIERLENDIIAYSEILPDESGTFKLTKARSSVTGPEVLELSYSYIQQDDVSGFRIHKFETTFYNFEVPAESDDNNLFFLIFYLSIFSLLTIVIIIAALRQIFAQRVDWKRAAIVLVFITILIFFRRYDLFADTFYNFIGSGVFYTDLLIGFLVSLFYGVYAALAYIAWESLARKQSTGQISLIDSVWSGKIFHKQVSKGVIAGYAIAGISLGIFGFVLFSANNVYALSSFGEFGFTEASTSLPALSLIVNALINSILFVIPQIAVIYCIIASFISKDVVRIPLTILISGITLTALSQFVDISGGDVFTLLLYTLVSVPIVLAYRYLGLMSAIFAWFTLVLLLRIIPFLGSADGIVSMHGWIAAALMLTPLLFSLVGIRYGENIKIGRGFLPDYEARRFKQLRSEKELAVAKESQFALLPSKVPEIDRLDVFGFFVPSYDVGGDFYDYSVIKDDDGNPKALALAIVDVSGKAMKAAFNAVFSSGLILSRILTDTPDNILTQINPILKEKTDPQTFITCQIGVINLENLKLDLANAGHCLPLLKRNGQVEFLKMPDPRYPLGVINKINYKSFKIDLLPGDVLMFYSDGFPEALNNKNERLGFDTTAAILKNLDTDTMRSKEICEHIKQKLLNYSNYELADDTTLICVKVIE